MDIPTGQGPSAYGHSPQPGQPPGGLPIKPVPATNQPANQGDVDPSTDICRHDLVLPADGGRALLATEDGGLLKADRIEWRAADGRLYAIFGPVTAEHRRPIGLLAPLVGLHLPAEVLVVHQPPAGEGRQRIPVAGIVLPLCSSPDGIAAAA